MSQLELTLDSETKADQRFEKYQNLVESIKKPLFTKMILIKGNINTSMSTESEKSRLKLELKPIEAEYNELTRQLSSHYRATELARIEKRPYCILKYN